jgi:tRNA nucleotidyltransferase/poly(A) polymerase
MDREQLLAWRLPPVVERIAKVVRSSADVAVYMVGGSVRDLLLGRQPKDLDFLVFGPIESFARNVAGKLRGKAIYLGQSEKAVWRVVGADYELDFVPPRGSSLQGDLENRDFTINALAWSVNDQSMVDLVGGLADLDRRLIRMTHPGVFQQDPVRLLRAFRLASGLGFEIEVETFDRIAADKSLIRNSASERIGMEFLGLLNFRAARQIRTMHETGLLMEILPECALSRRLRSQGGLAGAESAWESVLSTVESIEKVLESIESDFPGCAATIYEWLNEPGRLPLLKLSLLLLDLETVDFALIRGETGEGGHEGRMDEDIVPAVTKRLALSNKESRFLMDLTAKHELPYRLIRQRHSDVSRERVMLRLLLKMGDNVVGLLLLSLAAHQTFSRLAGDSKSYSSFLDLARQTMEIYTTIFLPRMSEPRLITGEDLRAAGLPPGPLYREVLEEAETARVEGCIEDRNAALEWLRERLAS